MTKYELKNKKCLSIYLVYTRSLLRNYQGFTYYRPLINVDGTHLYWRYDGKLLIVVVFMQIIVYSCF
ncbi:hypothetical protein Peur_040793 [Populus x canadensis]